MVITFELFLTMLKNGEIFYFVNHYIEKSTQEPHYHLCIHTEGTTCTFLLCGTSSPESTIGYLERLNISYSTFPCIRPDPEYNILKKDTYFSCNQIFEFTCQDLYNKYISGDLKHKGSLCESDKMQIKTGIEDSPILTEIDKVDILTSFPDV